MKVDKYLLNRLYNRASRKINEMRSSVLCYNTNVSPGMTGFDGGGWSRNASREAPNS